MSSRLSRYRSINQRRMKFLPISLALALGCSGFAFGGDRKELPRKAVHRDPVLLIHGIFDHGRAMEPMARYLRARGWEAHTMNLSPNNGRVGLEVLALQVQAEANRLFPRKRHFDLVGFSMGGIVSRYYLQRLGGRRRVRRFVSISAPHHGTFWARMASGPGCKQLRPQSPFLRELDSDSSGLKGVRVTSLWTPFDLMILPASSSRLNGARNETVPVLIHPLMISQKSSLARVAAALSE
jgi:triacylglycerol lipase